MLKCYHILLPPLTASLSLAMAAPHSHSRDDTYQLTACHDMLEVAPAFLTFRNEQEPKFQLAIKTTYHTYYPKVLKHALLSDHFQLTDISKDQKCGWLKARSVRASTWVDIGRHRGDIYWRYSDLRWVDNPLNISAAAHWIAGSDEHIPPRIGATPKNQTFDRISSILQNNEPAGDVFEISTVCLGYFCGLLAFVLFMMLLHLYLKSTPSSDPSEDNGVIELRMMAADSSAKLSSSSIVTATTGASCELRTYAQKSNDDDQCDPLPLYSVDGTGR